MPGVLPGDDRPHDAAALGAYVEGTVHLAIGDRYDNARLARFYRHVAANPAQLLNVSRLASEAALDRATVDRYLHALEDGFLLHRVPAYRSLPHKRVGAHPRLHPTDTALAAWAAGLSSGTLDRHPERIGPLLETLVVNELCAQGGWTAERFEILSWRDPGGAEVDVVIEDDAGRLVAIEVKAAERVDGRASRGIDAFRRRHGLCRGFVLHTGTVTAPLGDPAGGTWAVPIAALWTA